MAVALLRPCTLKLTPSSELAPTRSSTLMNLSSLMRVDGYAVRKSPSTVGFHTWLGRAAKRSEGDSERKQDS
jgi:hypothetical protein